MKTPPVGYWLTGLAAAVMVACVVPPAGAAPANTARLAAKCNSGDGVGRAHRVTYKLTVNGKNLGDAVLKRGDELTTDPSGVVDICLTLGGTACRINGSSVVQVVPSDGVLLSIARSAKHLNCETTSGKPVMVQTPQATIIFGTGRRPSGVAGLGSSLYSISVQGYATTVKTSGTARVVNKRGRVVVQQITRQEKIRMLWGSGQGSFRTTGRYSSAVIGP